MNAIKDDVDPDPDPFGAGEPGRNALDDDELINENDDDEYIESNVCVSDILSLQQFLYNLVMPEPGKSLHQEGHTNIKKRNNKF